MNGRDLRRIGSGPGGRTGRAHWLFAAILFAIVWTGSSLSTVQAWPAPASSAAASGVGTSRWDAVQRDVPRGFEAALPDPFDSAKQPDVDTDAAVPARFAIDVVAFATPRSPIEPRAGPSSPAHAFDARAPPNLR